MLADFRQRWNPGGLLPIRFPGLSKRRVGNPSVDVCLVVEGCYPYVAGGVSSWLDWLMRSLPERSFAVVAIVSAADTRRQRLYEFPPNLVHFGEIELHRPISPYRRRWGAATETSQRIEELAGALTRLVSGGGLVEFAAIDRLIHQGPRPLSQDELQASRTTWELVARMYGQIVPGASFLHFYWAWQALFGSLFTILNAPVPAAGCYHAICTGYAGLFAARASLQNGRPAILTEHGIYTNERRIEIMMADWIADSVAKGIALDDVRLDLRDIWLQTFEAYSRVCYESMSAVTTLYRDNLELQTALGANSERQQVIANGIHLERFENLPRSGSADQPTMALIGRVVPIKDVKSFITAAGILRGTIPDLRALVLGPTGEDPLYYRECIELVEEFGLQNCIEFTGSVAIEDWLPHIHVVVLTSLSEAQPLVLLEAGAAGIPCVTTDVGSCREIIEGAAGEDALLGHGGCVVHVVAPSEIAAAVGALIADEDLRRRQGDALRQRVQRFYTSERSQQAYDELYSRVLDRPLQEWKVE